MSDNVKLSSLMETPFVLTLGLPSMRTKSSFPLPRGSQVTGTVLFSLGGIGYENCQGGFSMSKFEHPG